MKCKIALALSVLIGSPNFVGSAAAQRPIVPPNVPTPVVGPNSNNPVLQNRRDINTFRSGLEVSVNGSAWARTQAVILTAQECPPSTTSPCGNTNYYLRPNLRYPVVSSAIDLRAITSIPGQAGYHYFLDKVVPLSSPGSTCSSGEMPPDPPSGTATLPIALSLPGQFPVKCSWAVEMAVHKDGVMTYPVLAIWSDTVTVTVTRR